MKRCDIIDELRSRISGMDHELLGLRNMLKALEEEEHV